jgi:hypothetical protein
MTCNKDIQKQYRLLAIDKVIIISDSTILVKIWPSHTGGFVIYFETC